MKRILRSLIAGAAFGLGVLAVAFTVPEVYAGAVAVFTGPSGSNPAASPQNQGDYNTIIQGLNNNAAWGLTGTPLGIIGAGFATTSKLVNCNAATPCSIITFLNNVTTTTGATTCNAANATECLGIIDQTSTLHWIPLY
jgi:hypothetical protein